MYLFLFKEKKAIVCKGKPWTGLVLLARWFCPDFYLGLYTEMNYYQISRFEGSLQTVCQDWSLDPANIFTGGNNFMLIEWPNLALIEAVDKCVADLNRTTDRSASLTLTASLAEPGSKKSVVQALEVNNSLTDNHECIIWIRHCWQYIEVTRYFTVIYCKQLKASQWVSAAQVAALVAELKPTICVLYSEGLGTGY